MNKKLFEILNISPLDGLYEVQQLRPADHLTEDQTIQFTFFQQEALKHLETEDDLCGLIDTPYDLNWILKRYDTHTGLEILERLKLTVFCESAISLAERALIRGTKTSFVTHLMGAGATTSGLVGFAAGLTTATTNFLGHMTSDFSSANRLNQFVEQPNGLYLILNGLDPNKALATVSILRHTRSFEEASKKMLHVPINASAVSLGSAFVNYIAEDRSLLPQDRTLVISLLPGSLKKLANILIDNLYQIHETREQVALGFNMNRFQDLITNYFNELIAITEDSESSEQIEECKIKTQSFVDAYEFSTAPAADSAEIYKNSIVIKLENDWGIRDYKKNNDREEQDLGTDETCHKDISGYYDADAMHLTPFQSIAGGNREQSKIAKSNKRIAEFCKAIEDLNLVCIEQTEKGQFIDHENQMIISAYKAVSIATKAIFRVLYTLDPHSFNDNAPSLVALMMDALPHTLKPQFYNVIQYSKSTQLALTNAQSEETGFKRELLNFLDKEIQITESLILCEMTRKNDLIAVLRNLRDVLNTFGNQMVLPCCIIAKIACDRELNRVSYKMSKDVEKFCSFFGGHVKIVNSKSSQRFMHDIGDRYCPWLCGVIRKNNLLFQEIHMSLFNHPPSRLNPGYVINEKAKQIQNFIDAASHVTPSLAVTH